MYLPIRLREETTACKARALAKNRQERHARASLGIPTLVVQQPGDIHAESREHPTNREPDARVPSLHVLHHRQDQIPSRTQQSEASNGQTSSAVAVREQRRSDAEKERGEVRRGRQALRGHRVVAHRGDDGGEEVGEAGKGVVAAEVDEGVHVVLVVA